MLVNKIGTEHLENGINNHDYGFDNGKIKCVVDGCSEGKHSEVGAKLFCHLFSKNENINKTFEILTSIFDNYEDIRNHLLFTIMYIEETENKFIVNICGDGVIIKQKLDNTIEYEVIDCNNMPPYYAYNYVPKENLNSFKNGVEFVQYEFQKTEYDYIGIATDGLNYILKNHKEELTKLILNRKESAIQRFINQNYTKKSINKLLQIYTIEEIKEINFKESLLKHDNFKDDITIII